MKKQLLQKYKKYNSLYYLTFPPVILGLWDTSWFIYHTVSTSTTLSVFSGRKSSNAFPSVMWNCGCFPHRYSNASTDCSKLEHISLCGNQHRNLLSNLPLSASTLPSLAPSGHAGSHRVPTSVLVTTPPASHWWVWMTGARLPKGLRVLAAC